jgi:hypothetical protein
MKVILPSNHNRKGRLGLLMYFYLFNFYFLERLKVILRLKIDLQRFFKIKKVENKFLGSQNSNFNFSITRGNHKLV